MAIINEMAISKLMMLNVNSNIMVFISWLTVFRLILNEDPESIAMRLYHQYSNYAQVLSVDYYACYCKF